MSEDVRVKLSAEGVQEIVDALKRIREEAKRTGEETAGIFEQLGERFDKVTEYFLSYLAIEKILDGMKDLFKDLYTGAIQLGNLSRETGFAVGSLQALDKMAEEAGVSQESMNKALSIFTRNIGMAEQGAKQGASGFSALGISIKSIKDLSPEQQLELVSRKLTDLKSASAEAAAGTQIFGRSFQEIQPVITDIAEGGLPKMIDHLRTLGLLMNDQVIAQVKQAHIAMTDLKDETEGLAEQFLLGLLPDATQAMDGIVKSIEGGGINGMKKLGEAAGWVIKQVVAAFQFAGATIGYVAARIEFAIQHAKDSMKDFGVSAANFLKNATPGGILIPDIKKPQLGQDYTSGVEAMRDEFGKQLAEIEKERSEGPASLSEIAGGRKGQGGIGYGAGASQLASARLQLIRAQLQAELAEYQAHAKLMEANDKEAYEAGKLSLEKYYKDRANIINGQYDLEISALKKQRAAIAALPIDPNDGGASAIRNRAQLAQLDGQLATKQIERQTALAQLAQQERQEQQRNYEQQLSAEQKLLTIENQKAEAAKLALELETQKLTLELQKSGASKAEIDKAVGDYKDQGLNRINFTDAKQNASDAINDLNAQIATIKQQVKDGALFPVQAEQQIIALEKQRLPVLQALAQQMVDLANKTKTPGNPLGDQGMIAQAEQFKLKVDDIRLSTDLAAQQMGALKQTAQDALQNGLATFLTNITSGTMTFTNAFKKMAFDIASSLVQLEAKFLANQFIRWLQGGGGAGGGGGASGFGSFFSSIGSFFSNHFAGGGPVRGPGTSTSDSIPSMLSDGEFVVNAHAAAKPGVLALLHAINGTPGYARGSAPSVQRYADGGVVSGGGAQVNHYHVDASQVPSHIIQQAIDNVVAGSIARQPVKIRSSLG
jgi:hypothetical protein